MKVKMFNEKIGDLVGENKLDEAIELLSFLLKGNPKLNDAIMQSSRLTDLMRQIRNGTINFEDANITKNNIRMAILSLAEEIEEKVTKDENLQKEFNHHSGKITTHKIIQNHSGSGDNVGGNKIINN